MNPETHYMLAHLAGKEPLTGNQFNDSFVINHAFWEQVPEAMFKHLQYPRTVNSLPVEDQARLAELTGDRAQEALSRLDFILTESDCRHDGSFEASADGSLRPDNITNGPELAVPGNPLYAHGAHYAPHQQDCRPSFNVHLRVMERLCAEGQLWIAIAPQHAPCAVWRYGHPKTEPDFVAPPALAERCLGAANINLVLEGLTLTARRHQECMVDMLVFKSIGIEVQHAEAPLNGRRWTIDPAIPFVTTRIDPDDLYSLCAHAIPLLIANEAFLQLLQTSPAEAQKLFDTAVLDIQTYSKQSEDESEFTLEQFREEYATNLALLFNWQSAQQEAITRMGVEATKLVREHLASLSPLLNDMLDSNVRGTEVHLKEFSLRGDVVTLRATVEHLLHVVKVNVQGALVEIDEQPRKRR